MKQNDVIAIYGKPNKNYKDEDDNVIFVYNDLKIRLTFYEEEDLKLGYLVASSPNLELFGNKIINRKITDIKKDLAQKVQDYLLTTNPKGSVTPYPSFSTAKQKELSEIF